MEIAIIAVLIVLNGVFSLAEMAVVSARKARLQRRAEAGSPGAQRALALAREPATFLATIQVGITLITILNGAYGEATLAAPLARTLGGMAWLRPHAATVAFSIVVVVITFLSLVIGELVPKRLALLNPEGMATRMARPMQALSAIMFPAVKTLSAATDLVLRLLGARAAKEPPVTEEEIRVLMEQGTKAGIFEKTEQELVRNVFRLDARTVGAFMTPRPDIVYLDATSSMAENLRRIEESGFSLFPVCKEGLDNVLGFVQAKTLLARSLAGKAPDLVSALLPPVYVPESLSGLDLLETFRRSAINAALVVDEYGEIQGLVTATDLLSAVVGMMPEDVRELAVRREDGSWLLDGMLPVEQLQETFQIRETPDEEARGYNTLGGLIMTRMGRIPRVADHFEWHGLRFEVVDMDKTRVDKVVVTPAAPAVRTPAQGAPPAPKAPG